MTGDREFPEDLREKMQGIIAVKRVQDICGVPPLQARQEAAIMKMSPMIEDLHCAFHELGRRRSYARFGLLQDSPRQILVLRDDFDSPSDD